ncbi:MAG: Lrp/AsnC family transcriptional regulator [Cohaesibacter sp.]|jgi:DNA-binding Lrp family transcriptional regulator|nr:Lrp/AsnC family transcriptional regulator [Cohaesibacter sp.]
MELDSFDLRLLDALQHDGAMTNQDLSEQVHLSASQCSRRRVRLEKAGIIKGYRAVLAPEKLGLEVTVFMNVTLNTHSRDTARFFRNLLQSVAAVREAHALVGDMDYLVKLVVNDLSMLSEIVNDIFLPHESVQHVRTSIVLESLKEEGPYSFDHLQSD